MEVDVVTDGPVSPVTTDAYVTGIELNFGNIGGSKSKSSVSKGVLYKPNLKRKMQVHIDGLFID